MSRRLMCTLGLLSILGISACAGGSSDGSSDGSGASTSSTTVGGSTVSSGDLDGNTYVSTGATGRDLVGESTVELTFSDGQLTVIAGCNTIGAGYELRGDTLTFTDEPRSTMMACAEDLTAQDQFLVDWFTDGVEISTTALGLTLTGGDVTIEFTKGAAPLASGLVGPVWTLGSTTTADGSTPVPPSAQAPTLEFAADGGVTVSTGCNTGGTTASSTDDTITFDALRLTKMACPDPAMALESTVLTVLDGEVGYTLDGNQLTLTRGSASLEFTGA